MSVFVLLFNARTDNEGIYSTQVGDRNVILMFEQEDDALRYADQLEAEDFPKPTVEGIDPEEIKEFCQDSDYDFIIVTPEMLVTPPSQNLEETDWQPEGKQQSQVEDDDDNSIDLEAMRKRLEKLL
ncbi:DUF3110 domain-containing protein [Chamaesiphon sp. VAR_48_metabat_403]|uniref:DUF3110 domain-containing protein n=1 Tax=Chamaesiphon sp. VAR_48_metabat_403 TaxID=2964700 RepID=UPI00286DC507|nr:DUF3110 domain-containing protein [Chamaesiphon sp. VAR_48_metabat_403]